MAMNFKNLTGVEKIDLNELKNKAVKYLLLDLDNTIIDFDRNLKPEIIEWVNQAKIEWYCKIYSKKVEKCCKAM